MTSKKEKKPKAPESDHEEQVKKPTGSSGGKLNLGKLEKQLVKATGEKAAELRKQIEQVKKWQSEYQEKCPQTEGELRKAIRQGDAQKVAEAVTKVIERKDAIGIEVPDNERRIMERARKWCQIVVDCEKIIKGGKAQTEVDFDRIFDIKSELDRIKCLDDIDCIKKIRAEFTKVDALYAELDKVSEYD